MPQQGLKEAAVAYERKAMRKSLYDTFVEHIGGLEGDYEHIDSQGILTTAYGINLEIPEYKQWQDDAIKANDGKPLDKTVYLNKAAEIFLSYEKDYRAAMGDKAYDALPTEQKFALHSARYNTGDIYKSQSQALMAYNIDPSMANRKAVIQQSRRTEKVQGRKAYTVGMDNRSLKELHIAGIVDPTDPEHQVMLKEILTEADPSVINPKWAYQDVRAKASRQVRDMASRKPKQRD